MIRKILAVFAALALVVGLAPAANAQNTGSTRIGDFTFYASINHGQSDLRPGGHVRLDLTATNTHGESSWIPPTTSHRVLRVYGFTVPEGFTLNGYGGPNMDDVGHHGQGDDYYGGVGGGV